MQNNNLIDISAFDEKSILELISFAENFILPDGSFKNEDLFQDKTIANVFFEPSTRTKISFEIAAMNLGCNVINFNATTSSLSKGETINETIDALGLMGVDLCILRSKDPLIEELSLKNESIRFINGGEGISSHPSQTLIDLMTIIQHKDSLNNLKIVIVGDIDHSRVAKSFVEGIKNFPIESLTFSGHPSMCKKVIDTKFGKYEQDLDSALVEADVIMALRIQKERFEEDINIDAAEYINSYQINEDRLKLAKKDCILMHPGPVNMNIELSKEAYNSNNSVIRHQIANGIPMRMAILSKYLSI
jgi:aspartate carbamoyltransferase catalytic subunit